MASAVAQTRAFLRDIKLEHSVFALPFAMLGMLLATSWEVGAGRRGSVWPTVPEFVAFLIAMVGARSAAMGFNRLADRFIDAQNPRTQARPLAAGEAQPRAYAVLVGAGLTALLLAANALNPLCVKLAPVAVVILFGYSYAKRFTPLCHWFLGLALGISPLAAWVGITGELPPTPAPYSLALAVIAWVGGFDIIYATMDVGFDRQHGIRSLPADLGIEPALRIARVSHAVMIVALLAVSLWTPGLGVGWSIGVAIAAGVLVYEHGIVDPADLRAVNTAFFTLNGLLGVLLLACGAVDLLRG